MKVRLIELHANRFGLLNQASNELLEDSTYEAALSAKFQEGAAWHLDAAFLGIKDRGNGAGRPLGILDPGNHSLVVVPAEAGQPAGTFNYENATNMYQAMSPQCRGRATWVVSNSLVPQLLRLQLVVKSVDGSSNVGGSASPMLNVADDGSMTLMTRPVVLTEKLPPRGMQGDVLFADLTQYCVGIRKELRLEKSTEWGFANYSTVFRLICRVDGQPLWAKPQILENGDVTSPFVTLAARSSGSTASIAVSSDEASAAKPRHEQRHHH
jgi:HK97 family phage major capsid protein